MLLTDCCGTKICFEGDTKNIDFIIMAKTSDVRCFGPVELGFFENREKMTKGYVCACFFVVSVLRLLFRVAKFEI